MLLGVKRICHGFAPRHTRVYSRQRDNYGLLHHKKCTYAKL